MDAQEQPATPNHEIENSGEEAPPWHAKADYDAPPEGSARVRHDAFSGPRKRAFLDALVKTGCILDACRVVGIAPRTVYNHRGSDARFDEYCCFALRMGTPELEISAWQRGVEGIEEPIYAYGKLVGTRIKRSDAVLRMLLEANLPEKYGRRIRFAKSLTEAERSRIREEVRAEFRSTSFTTEQLKAGITRRLDAVQERMQQKKLDQGWSSTPAGVMVPPGWSVTEDGHPIPPGYVRAEEVSPPGATEESFDSAGKSCRS